MFYTIYILAKSTHELTNENKTTHNMKLTQEQIDEAIAKATQIAVQEAFEAGLTKEDIAQQAASSLQKPIVGGGH